MFKKLKFNLKSVEFRKNNEKICSRAYFFILLLIYNMFSQNLWSFFNPLGYILDHDLFFMVHIIPPPGISGTIKSIPNIKNIPYGGIYLPQIQKDIPRRGIHFSINVNPTDNTTLSKAIL